MTSVTYGNKTISYSLNRADRKTLAITVKPDMSVVVSAPHAAEQSVDKDRRDTENHAPLKRD